MMSTLRTAIVGGLVVALAACSSEEAAPAADPPAEAVPEAPAPETDSQASAAKGSLGGTSQSNGQTGKLLYKYIAPKTAKYVPYVAGVVKSATMINAVKLFNGVLTLPKDIPLTVEECGKVDARYSGSEHNIKICYEIIDAFHTVYSSKIANISDAQKMAVTAEAIAFATLHEAGHAFIGENKTGSLGGEEDVVDDISGIFFVANGQWTIPLNGTRALVALQPVNAGYANEHSFSIQRYFNMLCLVYGSDPKKYASLVGTEAQYKLPQDRAVRCPKEWTDKKTALKNLIAPYIRK